MRRYIIGAIAVLIALAIVGGALAMNRSNNSGDQTSDGRPAGSPPTTTSPLQIVSIEPRVLESDPPQLQVQVSGIIPDSCTTAREPAVTRDGSTIAISILGQRPVGVACAQIISHYQQTITVGPLRPGSYTLRVNDLTQTVEVR